MRITIPDPQDQPSFRPIHFAAKQPNGEVHIFVWKSLGDAVRTLKILVPNVRQFLTVEHVRGLAAPDWCEAYDQLSHDEFAALWFARVVYTPAVVIPYTLEDLYDANGAAKHAKRLMDTEWQVNPFGVYRTEWELFVQKLVMLTPLPTTPQHPVARQELMIEAKPCKDCDVPPVGLIFPHISPNWVIYCPCCDMGTDPREGWNRATALEAWNKWN